MIMLADSKGSEGPDQTVRMNRLISAVTVRIGPMTHFHLERLLEKKIVLVPFIWTRETPFHHIDLGSCESKKKTKTYIW